MRLMRKRYLRQTTQGKAGDTALHPLQNQAGETGAPDRLEKVLIHEYSRTDTNQCKNLTIIKRVIPAIPKKLAEYPTLKNFTKSTSTIIATIQKGSWSASAPNAARDMLWLFTGSAGELPENIASPVKAGPVDRRRYKQEENVDEQT